MITTTLTRYRAVQGRELRQCRPGTYKYTVAGAGYELGPIGLECDGVNALRRDSKVRVELARVGARWRQRGRWLVAGTAGHDGALEKGLNAKANTSTNK